MNRRLFAFWIAPILVYIAYFSIKLILVMSQIWAQLAMGAWGIAFLFLALILILFLLIEHPFIQILFAFSSFFICSIIIAAFIGAQGHAFLLPLVCALYLLGFAFYALLDVMRKGHWKQRANEFHNYWHKFLSKNKKGAMGVIGVIVLSSIVSPILISAIIRLEEPTEFMISSERAQNYDLVIYFPDYKAITPQICSIFQEVNATLSFPLTENRFAWNDSDGFIASEAVEMLNNYSVKVEIWPLFEWEEGSYPSIAEIDRWSTLYSKFHNWTAVNNITVDYLLWDIESGGEGTNKSAFEDWISLYKEVAGFGADILRIQQIEKIWQNALETVKNLGQLSRADGHIMRTTTHTIIWDLFDGDSDIQKLSGLPVWDAEGAFEYISMMAYRGCEGGGNPATSAYIYEVVRASALTQPGTIAICLGCLNYSPYPEMAPIVNDVLLSLAAGCDSVRLFQANSWIQGVGEWEGSSGMVNGGPAHPIDGENGLRQLLLACRQGGKVVFKPDAGIRQSIFTEVFVDVLFDLSKPFV